MNEQAKEAMAALLTQVTELANDGVAFATSEIPIVLQQLVLRDRIYCTSSWLISVALFCVWLAGVLWCRREFRRGDAVDKYYDFGDSPFRVTMAVLSPIIGVIGFGCALGWIKSTLTVWFAPKLYIIEYLSDLLST